MQSVESAWQANKVKFVVLSASCSKKKCNLSSFSDNSAYTFSVFGGPTKKYDIILRTQSKGLVTRKDFRKIFPLNFRESLWILFMGTSFKQRNRFLIFVVWKQFVWEICSKSFPCGQDFTYVYRISILTSENTGLYTGAQRLNVEHEAEINNMNGPDEGTLHVCPANDFIVCNYSAPLIIWGARDQKM